MGTVPVLVRVLFTNVDRSVLMYVYAMSTVLLQSRYEYCTGTRTRTVKRARANHTSAYGTYLYARHVSTVFHGPVRIVYCITDKFKPHEAYGLRYGLYSAYHPWFGCV